MDDIGVIWTVASVLTGAILATASFVDGWQRWACFMVSFLPMFIATLIWAPVSGNSILRVAVAGTIGAIFGALLLVGTTQILHGRIEAQPTPPQEAKMPDNNPPLPQPPTGSGNFSIGQQGGSIHQTYINQVAAKLKISVYRCTWG